MAEDKMIVPSEEKELITQQEVWDVVNFARSMSGMYGHQYLTPDLINSRLKEISLNPMQATQDDLDKAMKNPRENETQLQKFSQDFEIRSMVYKRLISYLANMLAFDITYTSNAIPKDLTTPRYQKDLEGVEEFLEKFEYKKELRVVVREMLRNDAFFGCFVETDNKYVLQELPSEYCKITGRWEGGFLFSFNMYWFIQPGVDINMYPSFFKRKYNQIWGGKNKDKKYMPSIDPELRARSSWVYWVDIPVTFGVCFKLSPELGARLPYFIPLFNDLLLQDLMRNLQKNVSMAAASKMIVGEVPMLNRDAKATVKDSIAVSPELLGKFLALVKSSISDSIKVASAPLNDIKGISFDAENEIYDKYLRTALASSGVNTNLIFSSDIKPNAIETQLSLNVDEQMMTALYEQFNYFMEYFINRKTKTFKFAINFEGTEFFTNREIRLNNAMDLFDKGIIMPQKIAAALGMKPAHLRKHMEEAKANGFMSLLTPPSVEEQKQLLKVNPALGAMPASKSTTSDKPTSSSSSKRGRPRKSTAEIGEEGQNTRDEASNVGRGGKIL